MVWVRAGEEGLHRPGWPPEVLPPSDPRGVAALSLVVSHPYWQGWTQIQGLAGQRHGQQKQVGSRGLQGILPNTALWEGQETGWSKWEGTHWTLRVCMVVGREGGNVLGMGPHPTAQRAGSHKATKSQETRWTISKGPWSPQRVQGPGSGSEVWLCCLNVGLTATHCGLALSRAAQSPPSRRCLSPSVPARPVSSPAAAFLHPQVQSDLMPPGC